MCYTTNRKAPAAGGSKTGIILGVVGGIVAIGICGGVYYYKKKNADTEGGRFMKAKNAKETLMEA